MPNYTHIQLKRAEYTDWLTIYASYVPVLGEACVSFNTGRTGRTRLKVGTGHHTYSELPFVEDSKATEIPYDNSISGISATNLQDAIDQISELSAKRQIVSIEDLGISTTQFNTMETLIKKIYELPVGRISKNDKIIGNAPISIKVLDETGKRIDTTEFISDGQIEITFTKFDSFGIKIKANLESNVYYPYSWTLVDEYDGSDGKLFYWRSPLQNIDGAA